jgi:hypothetical protein
MPGLCSFLPLPPEHSSDSLLVTVVAGAGFSHSAFLWSQVQGLTKGQREGKRQSGEHIQQVRRPCRASVAYPGLLHLSGPKGTGTSDERKLLVGAARGQWIDSDWVHARRNDTKEPRPLLSAAPSQVAVTPESAQQSSRWLWGLPGSDVWLKIQVFLGSVPDFLSLSLICLSECPIHQEQACWPLNSSELGFWLLSSSNPTTLPGLHNGGQWKERFRIDSA